MANLTVVAADVALIEGREVQTGPAAEVITSGQYVRLDTTYGTWVRKYRDRHFVDEPVTYEPCDVIPG